MKRTIIISFCICAVSLAQTCWAKTKQPENISHIRPEAIKSLADNNLKQAASVLREQQPSDKSIYLLREINTIVMHNSYDYRPKRYDSYEFYKSVGIAYHNLFLFLKTKGIFQKEFQKKARKFYKRSRRFAGPLDKPEVNILMAALWAARKKAKHQHKAERLINKVDLSKLKYDYQIQECLAAYYAAQRNVAKTIKALRKAYPGRTKTLLQWIYVGDDFYFIKADPRFKALLNEWNYEKEQKQIILSLPQKTKPGFTLRHRL